MLPPRLLSTVLLPLAVAAAGPSHVHRLGPVRRLPLRQENTVTTHATGQFEVKLTPQPSDEPTLSRLSIDKQFRGDLQGTSKGEMVAAGTAVSGSAGYVAMERVTGTLAGRSGSFALQHSGTMNRGAAQLVVTVVPDSGTGELQGIAGSMRIDISGGEHHYDLDYTLPGG